jgi:hypothetical protein
MIHQQTEKRENPTLESSKKRKEKHQRYKAVSTTAIVMYTYSETCNCNMSGID